MHNFGEEQPNSVNNQQHFAAILDLRLTFMSRLLLFVALVDAGALNEPSLVQRWNAAVSEFEVEEVSEYLKT